MSDFIDAAHRERIIHGSGEHMFVEAGAGTGKTTAMVARIVELIAGGRTSVGRIVVITFTEAAAGELRERLRHSLEARRRTGSPVEQERCELALTEIELAALQTIHGFAQRIVSRFAIEIGIPPTFEVQDRIASKLLSDQRWGSYVRRLLVGTAAIDPTDAELIKTASVLGLNAGHLKTVAGLLGRTWYRAVELSKSPTHPQPLIDASRVLAAIDVVGRGFDNCLDLSDTLYVWKLAALDPWANTVRAAVAAGEPLGVLESLNRAPSLKMGSKGRKQNWANQNVDEQRANVMKLAAERDAALSGLRQWTLQGIVQMLARFIVEEADHRRRQGLIDFDDLLVYALRLVQMSNIASQLRQSYDFIFVDEFQDTDNLQVQLVDALVKAADDIDGAELFTVGDPKQSIYRFRGADLRQFAAVRNNDRANRYQLSTNFRSVSTVVEWVNRTFEVLLHDGSSEWLPLDAARRSTTGELLGSVHVVGDALDDLRARDRREVEASEIVSYFVRAKAEGWSVGDDGGQRPIRYGDMAALMPTRRSLPALERQLRQAGVPYRVESRSLIWATQEIREMAAILKAVGDPRHEVSVIAALRSPSFGCGDDDLYTWRTSGHGWNYLIDNETVDADHPVARALAKLRTLHDRHHWVPVSQFVVQVMRDLRMYELAFARTRQREAWHRLRFFVDRARAWTDDGGAGLMSFVQWVEMQDRESADALETVVPEADDDAVRLMTIHASKGLEFPLVAVVGTGSRDSVTDSARLLWTDDGSYEVRIGDKDSGWETPGFNALAGDDSAMDEAEQMRLLYVAVTRARDHLIVSLFRKATKSASGKASMASRMAAIEDISSVSSEVNKLGAVDEQVFEQRPPVDSSFDAHRLRASVIGRASRRLSLSATAIATKFLGIDGVLPHMAAGSSDIDANELAERLAFGSAVHGALEAVALDASDVEVLEVAEQKAEEFGLQHRRADIGQSVAAALSSHHVRRALAGGRWWREVPVYTSENEFVFGGTIDLLYEVEDELVIVDYKTEEVKDGDSAEHAIERYKWQLVTYAYACERTTGKKVRELVLLFIPPSAANSVAITIEPHDQLTERLVAEVLPMLV